MTSPAHGPSPLRSEFADDADMVELVGLFVSELGDRISRLEAGLAQNRLNDLRTLAHQLKGAAGGYGYPEVSRLAGVLENQLLDAREGRDLPSVNKSVHELVSICRRAIAGHNPPD
jgi:HPt (histidine-containing phosphotransfer) domain-containing protein